ncbi:MAG: DUF2586 domain-containing protein [Bacteroidia bacterium]|nr:DUF2586 domain-containing protein [Bacteroidia bacterium]
MYTGPVVEKLDGALGAKAANTENIAAMVFGGVVTANYATLGVSKKLTQLSDADDLGFTAAYDSTNKVLVRYHIDEFFRLNPNGTLWIMVVAQTVTMTQMCDIANAYLHKLISDSGKTVKYGGVIRNPATGYVATITDGIDADVTGAVTKAQQLADTWAALNIFIDAIFIEGRELSGTSGTWKDMRTMSSANVGVVVLQDPDVAALDALYAKTAAVGTVLGGWGIRRAEEDLGSINSANNPNQGAANMPINDAAEERFLRVAISKGTLTQDLSAADVAALKAKGYIFADSYPEYPGVYFSGSPACTLITSDYAYLVNTRVWNKAARIAVFKLTPRINSTVQLIGGKISATTASGWQEDTNNSRDGLGSLVAAQHCTKSAVFIDPNQDVFGTSKVVVKMTITPYGYAREIQGNLGFSI